MHGQGTPASLTAELAVRIARQVTLDDVFLDATGRARSTGSAGDVPSTTGFLQGQGYAAFQLPSSLLLAAAFGASALFLAEDVEAATSTSCGPHRSTHGHRAGPAGRGGGQRRRVHQRAAAGRAPQPQRRRHPVGRARVLPPAVPHAGLRAARPAGPGRGEVAASFSPVTYVMEALRSLILDDLAPGVLVVAVLLVVVVAADVRAVRAYD